jgi:CheY-like chemotaxis protein
MSDKENQSTTQPGTGESKPLKVMLAEDDVEDQEIFGEALENLNTDTELTVVSNGQELVNTLKDPEQENPDIIFLDINMPVKDGKEALAEIKKDKELETIPTVMLSTSDNPHEIKESFQAGASLFVTKPTSFNNLVRLLKKVFSFHWAGVLLRPLWQRFFISEKNISRDE